VILGLNSINGQRLCGRPDVERPLKLDAEGFLVDKFRLFGDYYNSVTPIPISET
jgi:hypothetical protein